MYQFEFKNKARLQLVEISKGNVKAAKSIADKIEWLAQNADKIKHERLQGKRFKGKYKLRVADYRIVSNSKSELVSIITANDRVSAIEENERL